MDDRGLQAWVILFAPIPQSLSGLFSCPTAKPEVVQWLGESEGTVAGYKVKIDDNFHFMTEDYRDDGGVFATADEAIEACKLIVDKCVQPMVGRPGMTAAALYGQYEGFGDDPFIVPVDPNDAPGGFLCLGICQGSVHGNYC
jgi:hypothetical protein